MDNNPFPGKKRGITMNLVKSLGAVAKVGATPVTVVYDYAEQVTASGFVFIGTPALTQWQPLAKPRVPGRSVSLLPGGSLPSGPNLCRRSSLQQKTRCSLE